MNAALPRDTRAVRAGSRRRRLSIGRLAALDRSAQTLATRMPSLSSSGAAT